MKVAVGWVGGEGGGGEHWPGEKKDGLIKVVTTIWAELSLGKQFSTDFVKV